MTDERIPPKFEDAPGIVVRARKAGWTAFWLCRTDLVERGFKPVMVPLWRGQEPGEADRKYVSDQCNQMQTEMLIWGRGGLPGIPGPYDGTIRSLANCYVTDPDSTFLENRYRTRENYKILLRRVIADHGDDRVADLNGREMKRWHKEWAASGHVAMAHSLMRMVRGLFGFGLTLLECEHCTRMCVVLKNQRFAMGKSRTERLTAEHAIAIRAEAHKAGYPSIALAQAIQFECMLRQKDIIGEWVPASEPGLSDITHDGQKWLRGIRWSEIDDTLNLRHITSKRQKMIEPDLRLMPMVLEEFKLIYKLDLAEGLDRSKLKANGAVIVNEDTDRPYIAHQFRRLWRGLARKAGVPDSIRNMDTRAGAISEATDAGAQLEDVRHAATHSDISMTQKYSRGSVEKAATVQRLRTAHRNKSGT